MIIEIIVWAIVAGIAVFLLYCMLGVIPFFLWLLRLPFRRTKQQTTDSTKKGTEEETGEVTDDDNAEERGKENSAVMDEED